MLLKDTSTWLCAAEHEWKYPATKEYLMQLTTFDLLHAVNSKKKPKPLERPYVTEEQKDAYREGHVGNTVNVDQNKVREHLVRLGHTPKGE